MVSERFTVAVCTCRRSRIFPWCDTSHRRRCKPSGPDSRPEGHEGPEGPEGHDTEPGRAGEGRKGGAS
ncbi:CDGSH iron-sulfur domain-containing protein [Streptomyces sp. GD-15H]|uniref:CDGSH iron-sulfur domain-containing protein n=1 Tax=Streptomyces sp. GD-15H TaxID=3129112 RepID=UPI003873BEBA